MIRKSTENDIDTIMQFIDYGRQKMVAEGNIHLSHSYYVCSR